MATAAKVQKKAVKPVPIKRIKAKDGIKDIPLARQARQAKADAEIDFSAMSDDELLKFLQEGLVKDSIDPRSLMEILYDGRR